VGVVLLSWLVLAGRLVQLQWVSRPQLAQLADRQRSLIESIPARPGEIVDRHGRLLATTVTSRSLYVDPSRIVEPWRFALQVAESLDIDADQLFERISRNRTKRFLWVHRRLDDEQADGIRDLELPQKSWGFREEYLRRYPQGQLAAHLLGLRDIDGKGRGGLEQSLESIICGRNGKRTLVRDARGRVVDVREAVAQAPRHGRTVVLTIDAVVQLYAERELDSVMQDWKPKSACAIVVDPRTCEVLAMASRPAFDPNRPINVPAAAWKNTAISAIYEPGSTFKPFVVAWALEQGVIDAEESFHCENGSYRMGRRILHDHHPYGRLSLTDVLVKSSNIGMAKIGERLTNKELFAAAVRFGFGRKTGIALPGELQGMLRPLKKWNSYSTGSIPMGQEIAVTPLQLISAISVLAGDGVLRIPRLVSKTVDHIDAIPQDVPATSFRPTVTSPAIKQDIGRWLVADPLVEVVRRGTGTKAQLKDYNVFGKTGTAQKPDPVTGKYSSQLHVSSFFCGAPADDPRVIVLIVADEPAVGKTHYGGTVAAPAASRLLHKTLLHLRIPPSDGPLREARRP
jgi:cell division protein FtsI/penicillin-binding protein 2